MLKILKTIFAQRELIAVFIYRNLKEKNIGAVLGFFWIFFNAVFPTVAYMLVFFFILKPDLPADIRGPFEYLVFIFCGMISWQYIVRVATQSSDLINQQMDMFKQAIFPIETVSVVALGEAFLTVLLQMLLLVAILPFSGIGLSWGLLLVPVFLLVISGMLLGISWIVSAAGYFLRDLKDMLMVLFQMLIFLTPVLYTRSVLPPKWGFLFYLNPATHIINCFRDLVYYQGWPHWYSFPITLGLSAGCFFTGLLVMSKVKKIVGDMI